VNEREWIESFTGRTRLPRCFKESEHGFGRSGTLLACVENTGQREIHVGLATTYVNLASKHVRENDRGRGLAFAAADGHSVPAVEPLIERRIVKKLPKLASTAMNAVCWNV
jgi:hypothetical protein